jgi:hypothetical protein
LKNSIIEKLNIVIENGEYTESDVVYCLVQFRKLLDHERFLGANKYPLIRFYSNWVVHTDIEDTRSIRSFLESLDNKNFEFIGLEYFAGDLGKFLSEFGLSDALIKDEERLFLFLRNLGSILIDIPIHNPTSLIESFSYRETKNWNNEKIKLNLSFSIKYKEGDSIGGDFLNAA